MSWLPWAWLVVALLLCLIEAATGTFMFLLFAVAAVLAALAGFVGAGVTAQTVLFLIGTAAALVCAPALARRLNRAGSDMRFGVDALVDEIALVTEAIDPILGGGMVKVGGQVWRATASTPIAAGERVRVAEISGTRVVVYRLPEAAQERLSGDRPADDRVDAG